MGVLTPHRALSLCWSRSGQKLHIPRAPQMFHGCTSQRFSNSAASPSSERQSLPLQRTRTGHKEWRRGGGRCRNLQPLFLNSFYSPSSSRVPRSTFAKRGTERSRELRVLPTVSDLNPAPLPRPSSAPYRRRRGCCWMLWLASRWTQPPPREAARPLPWRPPLG